MSSKTRAEAVDRQAIFATIKSRLNSQSTASARAEEVASHLRENSALVVPEYLKETNDYLTLFCNKARSSQAKVHELENIEELSTCIDRIILAQTTKGSLFLSADCKKLNFKLSKNIRLIEGIPDMNANWGLSLALAGAAESGTLLVASKDAAPITLNIIPENSIVLLESNRIVPNLEKAINEGYQTKPRAMVCITGPSRTADIAQQLVMGAHGPKALHIVIIPPLS